jgi:eukaryotic-like serine/threonine-protein kinase
MTLLAENTIVDGRYRLLHRIGSGGMADVWCAEDTQLARPVALKVLNERFAQDEEFIERFRREAQSAAGLRHPNVVNIFDRGQFDGTYYIAMEYVEGSSLKELIDRGLSVDEAIEIIRQVLGAAKHAHEHGIIHRDLKPANVLIDKDGRAAVADFGIARAGVSEITQAGSVMGTAQYLSPEQAQGLSVTEASDLYSIGVMLYEALTGRVPFSGDSAVAVAMKQVSEAPVPPSQFNPAVPRALDAVVLRALAKDPANRYVSADQFLAALDAAEADPDSVPLGDTAVFGPAVVPLPTSTPAAADEGTYSGPPDERPTRKKGRRWPWIVTAILLAALLAFGIHKLTQPDQLTVPDVTGSTETAAMEVLRAKGFDVATKAFPSDSPKGLVIEQDPTAASTADEGSTVTLTVSSGPGRVKVPGVDGLSQKAATKKLKKIGLEVKIQQRFSTGVAKGDAIGTDPDTGETVSGGSTVTLFISMGANLVRMPSVVGEDQEVAQSQLERSGLIVNTDSKNSDRPEGQVIEQDPTAGSSVKKHSTVTIVVSTGAGSVVVKDVTGRNESSAVRVLQSQGLSVKITHSQTTDQTQDGKVIDELPPAGTRLRAGDRVTITVGKLSSSTIP